MFNKFYLISEINAPVIAPTAKGPQSWTDMKIRCPDTSKFKLYNYAGVLYCSPKQTGCRGKGFLQG